VKKTTKIIVLFALLIPLLAALPWLDGLYVKHRYVNLINNINYHNGNNDIQIAEYRVGWLSSHVKLQFKANNTTINLMQDISHGPIVRDAISDSLTIAAASLTSSTSTDDHFISAFLASHINGNILYLDMTAYFTGNVYGKLTVPPLTMTLLGKIGWQGLKANFNFNLANDYFSKKQTDVNFGAINVEVESPDHTATYKFDSQPVKIQAEADITRLGLWVGSSKEQFPGFTFHKDGALIYSLANLSSSTDIAVRADKFYNVAYQVKTGAIQMQNYSQFNIINSDFTLAINDLDAAKLVDALKNSKDTFSQAGTLDADAGFAVMQHFSKAVTPTSTVKGTLMVNTALGVVQAELNANWPKGIESLANKDDLAKMTNLKIHVKIAVPLARGLADQYFASYVPAAAPPEPQPAPQATVKQFNDVMGLLVEQGKLDANTAVQVMQMHQDSASLQDFNSKLAELGIDPETVAIINHSAELVDSENKAAAENAASTPAPIANTPVTAGSAVIDEWLKQGYLIQDQNDYVADIVYENSVTTVNGKLIENNPE